MIRRSGERAGGSAEITSAPSRSRRMPATADLPDAVGPNSARTCSGAGAGRLFEAMRDVGRGAVGILDDGDLLLRVLGPPFAEPRDGALDAFLQRHLRVVAE